MTSWTSNLREGDTYLFSHDEMNYLNTDKTQGRITFIGITRMELCIGRKWSWSKFGFEDIVVTLPFDNTQPIVHPPYWMKRSSSRDAIPDNSINMGSGFHKAKKKDDDGDDYRSRYGTGSSSDSDSWTPSWGMSTDDSASSSSSSDSSFSFGGGDFGGGGGGGDYGGDSGGGDSGGGDGGGGGSD